MRSATSATSQRRWSATELSVCSERSLFDPNRAWLGLGSARPVLEAKPQILGVVAESTSEQVQPSDVLGVRPDADAYDDRITVGEPE